MSMRSKLFEYESSGSYVFHGSPNGAITLLEPRQSTSFGRPDGEPSISASSHIEPAIFMAIISRINGGAMGIRPTEKNPFGMVISESTWTKAKNENWQGYVYVLEKVHFTQKDTESWEWRSTQQVHPVDMISISHNDIDSKITTLPDQKVQSYIDNYMLEISCKN